MVNKEGFLSMKLFSQQLGLHHSAVLAHSHTSGSLPWDWKIILWSKWYHCIEIDNSDYQKGDKNARVALERSTEILISHL